MNKKLIAIAVASVMAAPVAMADLKISGRLNQQWVNTDTDGGTSTWNNTDNGHQRLQFDVTSGDAYGRMALDERFGRDNTVNSDSRTKRDQYVGYKFGASSLQYGRMANAGKNIEKDPLIATFLEVRSSVASTNASSAYESSSFVNEILQFATKAGGATIKVQVGMSDNDVAASNIAGDANQGYIAVSATGKAGPVRWFVSHNNDAADGTAVGTDNDDSNLKIGASMKFGKVNATLAYKASEDGDGAGAPESTAIVLRANMGFGNGLTGYAGFATNTFEAGGAEADATWIRLAVAKKLSKGVTLYGGYTTTDFDDGLGTDFATLGAGMTIKF